MNKGETKMQESIFRNFMIEIKMLNGRAREKNEREKIQEYEGVLRKLEEIRNRRALALISEENEEKKLYKEIIEILEEKNQDTDVIYEQIKAKIEPYKLKKIKEDELER